MPKRRRCSSSLGRKTKVAKKSQEKRRQESPESRERRLHQNRACTSSARRQESPDTRDRRLHRQREATAAARRRESPDTRGRRLQQDREATIAARRWESPDMRGRRLQQNREATAAARRLESPDKRSRRLHRHREATAAARRRESPDTRSRRLQQDREATAAARRRESPDTRNRRLQQDREAAAARRRKAPYRIELKHQDEQFIEWNRRQFPVRPAFAMTINKSQSQTLKKVGVWLEEPTFTHGQLYVTASRDWRLAVVSSDRMGPMVKMETDVIEEMEQQDPVVNTEVKVEIDVAEEMPQSWYITENHSHVSKEKAVSTKNTATLLLEDTSESQAVPYSHSGVLV